MIVADQDGLVDTDTFDVRVVDTAPPVLPTQCVPNGDTLPDLHVVAANVCGVQAAGGPQQHLVVLG